jgi:hypothetical protein
MIVHNIGPWLLRVEAGAHAVADMNVNATTALCRV